MNLVRARLSGWEISRRGSVQTGSWVKTGRERRSGAADAEIPVVQDQVGNALAPGWSGEVLNRDAATVVIYDLNRVEQTVDKHHADRRRGVLTGHTHR